MENLELIDINKIKEENKFFIPNFSLLFKEYLDIFSVFNSIEKVHKLLRNICYDAIKFYDLNNEKDVPSVVHFTSKNTYVVLVDYGFFLHEIIKFIANEGGIVDENEIEKVKNLIYLFFGVSLKNYRLNFSSQVLTKTLFGTIYGITNYKNVTLKGSIFYPYFYQNKYGIIYQLNMFFIKKTAIEKAFNKPKERKDILEKIEKISKNIVTHLSAENASKEKVILYNFKKKFIDF